MKLFLLLLSIPLTVLSTLYFYINTEYRNTDVCLAKIKNLNPNALFDFYRVPKEYRKNLVFNQNYAMGYIFYQLHYCTTGQKMYGEN